jgi:hypothetical protein
MSRTKRKPYTQSKRFDTTCRCHGSCEWCEGNRRYQDVSNRKAADMELSEFFAGANRNKRINVGGGPLDMEDVYGAG